jgi:hypothetical protein
MINIILLLLDYKRLHPKTVTEHPLRTNVIIIYLFASLHL